MTIRFCLGLLLCGLSALNSLAQTPPKAASPTKAAPSLAYVVGHRNPDLDSIASAIGLADLMTRRGVPCVPAAQGKVTPDTAFVLAKFGLPVPEIITDATHRKVLLTDHSDTAQSLDNMAKGEILAIVDHHKLGDVTTRPPLEMWVWPVGSTCTVVAGMYDFYGLEIPKGVAGTMLCALLSDTLLFKSSTTTPTDHRTAEKLARIEGIRDIQALGMEVFRVKANLAGTPAKELLLRDYKDFTMGGKKVGIGQIEVMGLSTLDPYKAGLRAEMNLLKADKGLSALFLMLTDILTEGTELLLVVDDGAVVEKAFGRKPQGDRLWLPGVMSRKKDVVPTLEKAFAR